MPQLPSYFTKSGHIMPAFNHSIMVLGSICDTECSVNFHNHTVTIYDSQGSPLIQGWRDNTGAKLWRFVLHHQNPTPSDTEEDRQAFTAVPYSSGNSSDLQAFSAYDFPSVEAPVRYFHAAAGSQSNQRGWIPSSMSTLPLGLAWHIIMHPSNAHRLMIHLKVTWHIHAIMYSQPNPIHLHPPNFRPALIPHQPTPLRSQMRCTAGILQYQSFTRMTQDALLLIRALETVMLWLSSIVTVTQPFRHPSKTNMKKHRIEAYKSIWGRLKSLGHTADLQILDNESSTEYKRITI